MDAVIFDFDGVVVDSERYWDDVDKEFFGALIPGWTIADGDRMSGTSPLGGYEMLTREYGLTMPQDEYLRLLETGCTPIYGELCQPVPGVRELLERLTARKMPVAIASSSRLIRIRIALDRLGLSAFFPVIATSDEVPQGKPAPDVFLLAAKRLGITPERCLAIEDSRNGVRAAKAAEMTCVAIRTDMNPRQDLTEADREISDFTEIDALLSPT